MRARKLLYALVLFLLNAARICAYTKDPESKPDNVLAILYWTFVHHCRVWRHCPGTGKGKILTVLFALFFFKQRPMQLTRLGNGCKMPCSRKKERVRNENNLSNNMHARAITMCRICGLRFGVGNLLNKHLKGQKHQFHN